MPADVGQRLAQILQNLNEEAQVHPFVVGLHAGSLPGDIVDLYLLDTYWAVCLFPTIAANLARRQPMSVTSSSLSESAEEELTHPVLFERVLQARGIDETAVREGRYQPASRLYEYFWRWAQVVASYGPWEIAVATVTIGIEGAAPIVEAPVADALVGHYGVSRRDAEWFFLHSGELERGHRDAGFALISDNATAEYADAIVESATFAARAMVIDCPTSWISMRD
jgi:pyrroloquinoline quinone (PQQ) biosynthesis protein C